MSYFCYWCRVVGDDSPRLSKRGVMGRIPLVLAVKDLISNQALLNSRVAVIEERLEIVSNSRDGSPVIVGVGERRKSDSSASRDR